MFSAQTKPVTPDFISAQFTGTRFRSSVYSYLFRLHKQGLLSRGKVDNRIVYSISDRGIERLGYLASLLTGDEI
jgi:DNA-binding PadR family transcriptional regulator